MSSHKDVLDAIKDIDYYKAETQAARNGQDAAMKRAAQETARANFYERMAQEYTRQIKDWKLTVYGVTFIWLVTMTLYILRVIGVL